MTCLLTYFNVEFGYILFLSFIGHYLLYCHYALKFRTDNSFNTEAAAFESFFATYSTAFDVFLVQFYNFITNQILLHSKEQAAHSYLLTYWCFWTRICNLYEIVCVFYRFFSLLHSCLYSHLLSFFSYHYCDSSQLYTDSPFNIEAVYSLSFYRFYFTTSQCFFLIIQQLPCYQWFLSEVIRLCLV